MPAHNFQKGDKLNGCTILQFIGSGRYAEVYKAQSDKYDTVALKYFINPDIDYNALLDEAFTTTLFNNVHHIVTIYDARMIGGMFPVIYMEYMEGGTLRDRLNQRIFPTPDGAAAIVCSIAQALVVIHQRGFVHRDICPENILFDDKGTAKLGDLGVALHYKDQGIRGHAGHPNYMDPALTLGKLFSFRSDLYSLGIIFYELLTSELPYKVYNVEELKEKYESDKIKLTWPELQDISDKFKEVIEKAFNKEYNVVEEFLSDMEITDVLVSTDLETSTFHADDIPEYTADRAANSVDVLIDVMLDRKIPEKHLVEQKEHEALEVFIAGCKKNLGGILNGFKEEAKLLFYYAVKESQNRRNCYIGIEHLILALLKRETSVLSRILSGKEKYIQLRELIEKHLESIRPLKSQEDILSPRLKAVIERAKTKIPQGIGEREFLHEVLKERCFVTILLEDLGIVVEALSGEVDEYAF